MRELTDLEIEQFDFNGKIPELNKPVRRKNAMAVESKTNNTYRLKPQSLARKKRRLAFA